MLKKEFKVYTVKRKRESHAYDDHNSTSLFLQEGGHLHKYLQEIIFFSARNYMHFQNPVFHLSLFDGGNQLHIPWREP